MVLVRTTEEFARMCHDILRSDRDVNLGVSGMTGEGKSTFLTHVFRDYAKISGTYWGFDRMTWSRKEMLEWIDGKNRLKQYSGILADELFLMFYRRNWSDVDQIDAIGLFNMCRDRHLLIGGNIPQFSDLDGAFQSRIRFYCYIPKRGVAWIFKQETNPFMNDPWNTRNNMKIVRKYGNPYKCRNFLFQINFGDWTPEEKAEYLEIRNVKRKIGLKEQAEKKDKKETYRDIKLVRNSLILKCLEKGCTPREIAEVTSLSYDAVCKIKNGKL